MLHGPGRGPLLSRHVSVVETVRANWFLLDSLDRVNTIPGELGEEQLTWLGKALDARADNPPVLVVVHHDPQWSGAVIRTGLGDTEQLFEVLVPRKQVKAVMFGHTHLWHRTRVTASTWSTCRRSRTSSRRSVAQRLGGRTIAQHRRRAHLHALDPTPSERRDHRTGLAWWSTTTRNGPRRKSAPALHNTEKLFDVLVPRKQVQGAGVRPHAFLAPGPA